MAGTGPAPKLADERRRRNEPARGEWTELPPLAEPVIAARPPARAKGTGPWSKRTLAAWRSWRADPVGAIWGPAERDAIIDLAYLHHEWCSGKLQLSAELRLRMDGLGLTPKGKRDLRLRVVEALDDKRPPKRQPPTSSERRARLSVVK